MDVNDRGTMKWTSLMLPEHVKALSEMWQEFDHKEKPVLDEQQIIDNGLKLQEALEYDSRISIRYFKDHDYKTHEGHLLHIDTLNKKIYMEDMEIMFERIIEVSFL